MKKCGVSIGFDSQNPINSYGGGRWYDPALGRPLQPNGAGGPPLVPQALNRYAATGVGQPGVAETTFNAGNALAIHSVQKAVELKLIDPIFIGDENKIIEHAKKANWDISSFSIIHEPDENSTA